MEVASVLNSDTLPSGRPERLVSITTDRSERSPFHSMNDTQSLIIQLLRKHGSMTREQLSRLMGLTAMGTSIPLSALQRAGIVQFGLQSQPRPGRPSKSVSLSPKHCLSLGIAVSHLEIQLAIVNLRNEVIDFQRLPFAVESGVVDFSPVISLVGRMLKPYPRKALFAAGFSFSGDFEFDTDHILKTNDFSSPGQAELLRRQISKKIGHPVQLIHDTEACLIAERWSNPDLSANPTLLHVGDRLGFAVMIDGHLCRGTPQWPRWLGRVQVPYSTEKPSGLLPGALAGTADVFSWLDRLNNYHYGERPPVPPETKRAEVTQFYKRWLEGDPVVRELVEQGARDLATVVGNLCLLFPFQHVICTGWIPEVRERMISSIKQKLQEILVAHRIPLSDFSTSVSSSILAEKNEAAGAAFWAIDRALELKMSHRGWKHGATKANS